MRDRVSTLRRAGVALVLTLVSGLGLIGSASAATIGAFSYGQLQGDRIGGAGCGTNAAGEPSIHVSRANNVFLGSETGLGKGSQLWRGLGLAGGASASGCHLEYRGQPNALTGAIALAGGDIDIAIASARNSAGNYNVYVSSLNLASVSVAHSTDNATTFSMTPVQAGLPLDDREWIAAFGADTSLLTFHDMSNNIDVLRSEDDGMLYAQIAQVVPPTDYKASNNQHGNLVIDHRNLPASSGSFFAYQSFVAPSTPSGSQNNEAFLGVSADGGHTWIDRPVPCSVSSRSLDHNFPNISVDPGGNVWYAWSDDHNIFTAESSDRGRTWKCSGPLSTNTEQAIFPWLVATSAGVDLVYYGSPESAGPTQTWYVYFAQNITRSVTGWGQSLVPARRGHPHHRAPQRLMSVHRGVVCESGATCTSGRQLFDDFGVDTDSRGWAHIAYSHDSPSLGGPGSYTGSAIQISGRRIGRPNN